MKQLILTLTLVVLLALSLSLFRSPRANAARVEVRSSSGLTSVFRSSVEPLLVPATVPLVVNSTGDAVDNNPGDGLCTTGGLVGISPECTLRAAIQEANAVNDVDTINFTIPTATDAGCNVGTGVCTISPASGFPAISQPLTMDGYTQVSASQNTLAIGNDANIKIELNGTGAGAGSDGLAISAGSCTVRGLAIYKFLGDGIELRTAGSNTIEGNFIGTNATGLGTTNGNSGDGVFISNVGTNSIGGSTTQARNLISANGVAGVDISGSSATGNSVQGNYIGTDRNGTADVGNTLDGVFVGGPSNLIGGSTATLGAAAGNVISGNGAVAGTGSGVRITTGGNSNTVAGNLIGVAAGGTAALGNSNNGVYITNTAATNTIGGILTTLRNVISSNTGAGVAINGSGTTGNLIQGNYIGTDLTGTLDRGNTVDGVLIDGGAATNTVGGSAAVPGTPPGNLISGNGSSGVASDGVEINGASSNKVQGNLIGTNAAGTAALLNNGKGVLIANNADNNEVGGATSTQGTGLGNVISGNNSDGIEINGSTTSGNVVQGNLIGFQVGGTALLRNGSNGVLINASPSNTVGGASANARNIITAGTATTDDGIDVQGDAADSNLIAGNYIGTDINGTADMGAGGDGVRLAGTGPDNNTIGGSTSVPGTAPGNVISGNGATGCATCDGVEIVGNATTANTTTGNKIQGNIIGLKADGLSALKNERNGVNLNDASSTTIGGSTSDLRNIISGNNTDANTDGIDINGENADNNTVAGNYIGTDINGTAAIPNGGNGVFVNVGPDNSTIGGATSTPGTAPGNVISGNTGDGVEIEGGSATGHLVQGNLIGLQAGGTASLGNGANGVVLNLATSITIGGSTNNLRNIISGNGASGVVLFEGQSGVFDNNIVAANYIGTDVTGLVDLGNTTSGVRISAADGVTIGGVTATPGSPPGNVISGNNTVGIDADAANDDNVQGNLIGLKSNGTDALNNSSHGIHIRNSAVRIVVGGTIANVANTIAFNGGDGVFVASGTGNRIASNSIYSNTELGIDLGANGVTANDNLDPDSGANNLQNFPIITSANFNTQVIVGRLNSLAGQAFTINFYKNPACDGTNGEGKTYLGSQVTGTTDANGDVTFTFNSPVAFTGSDVITATATDSNGNTSEFSQCATATAVRLRSFEAVHFGEGVELHWDSGFEINNLGYQLYRVDEGGRTRVTPSLVAGSALRVGQGVGLSAGYSYSWFDEAGSSTSVYLLEAIDLDGGSSWTGPVTPIAGPLGAKPQRPKRATLLNEITAGKEKQDESVDTWPASIKSSNVRAASLTSDLLETQQTIAGGKAVKIAIQHDGWYRLTQSELAAAGMDLSSDARMWQLYVDGKEIPFSISTEGAGFTATDSIEFYGVGLDTPTTDTRVYWLVAGAAPGKRVLNRRAKLKPADYSEPVTGDFQLTVERKEKLVYFSSLLNGDEENIFGSPVRNDPTNQTLSVKHLAVESVSQPLLEVALQGLTAGNHQVQVKLNGTNVGSIVFADRDHSLESFPISLALLHEGDNIVSLASVNGQSDVSLIDWVRLAYPHQYKAENNRLMFSVSAGQPVRVEGFDNTNIRVVDVTDSDAPTLLPAAAAVSGNAYSIKVQTAGSGVRTVLAVAENTLDHPSSMTSNQPSNLNAESNGADLVIIAHRDFKQVIEPLANLRRSQGLSVAVIDVEDIFDEFSYGAHDPEAIRKFLLAASAKWTRKPAYLLLVGDSSWDPRSYLHGAVNDFVPTKLIDTQTMETSSDDWFADFNNLGQPQLAVGRLPVRTVSEASLMVTKIISYEQERDLNAPLRGAVMVSDRGFETQSSQTMALLPSGMTVQSINRADVGNDDMMRGQIVNALNQGPLLVNYYGHGSVRVWTGDGLLNTDMAANLTNTNRLSVFVMMTCLNGYASDANVDSLGEAVLKAPNGGAVAVWASSGFTTPQPQFEMNKELYRILFGGQAVRLGEAIRSAKAATDDFDVRRTWMLLGDPTTRVR